MFIYNFRGTRSSVEMLKGYNMVRERWATPALDLWLCRAEPELGGFQLSLRKFCSGKVLSLRDFFSPTWQKFSYNALELEGLALLAFATCFRLFIAPAHLHAGRPSTPRSAAVIARSPTSALKATMSVSEIAEQVSVIATKLFIALNLIARPSAAKLKYNE